MPKDKKQWDKNHIFPINGSDFFCQFKLKSADSYEAVVKPAPGSDGKDKLAGINLIDFTKSAIVSLDLVDSLFEPFTNGTITVNNPFDYIEDNVQLRGDGKDILEVTLFDTNEPQGPMRTRSVEERQLKYQFVIQDENNDVSKTDRSNNFKTYTLMDIDYWKLNEAVPYGKTYNGLVGDIIKDILEEFGFDIHPTKWAPGDHLIYKFPENIIPPAGWRYSDLIKYLLRINFYISGDGELPVQGILKQERTMPGETTGKFTLQPLTKYFSDNKELTQESFTVADLSDEQSAKDGDNENPNNTAVEQGEAPFNVNTGTLKNVNLVSPMTRFTNEFFMNYTVSTHDVQTGQHTKDTVVIEDIKERWTKAFVEVFKCVGGKPKPNLYLDKKNKNIYKNFSMPFRQHVAMNLAYAQMASNLLFFNLQLNFDNIGDTYRRTGRFIDVFRKQHDKRGGQDSKLLGRWFITTLHHRFFKDKYQNVIQCVKPCIGPDKPPGGGKD